MRTAARLTLREGQLSRDLDHLLKLPRGTISSDINLWGRLWNDLKSQAAEELGDPRGVQTRMHYFRRGVRVYPRRKNGKLVFRPSKHKGRCGGLIPAANVSAEEAYPFGPLEGTKSDLGSAMGGKGRHPYRRVDLLKNKGMIRVKGLGDQT
jgi:hypothetical protein